MMVPANRFVFLRNSLTQRKRKISQGLNWTLPWESVISVTLPSGEQTHAHVNTFQGSRFRYDPPPYQVLTQDQVKVTVDLSVTYDMNIEGAIDFPTNFAALLDDTLRSKTQQLVSQLKREDVNINRLIQQFAVVQWEKAASCTIVDVVVQNIEFDKHMEAILRARSAGMDKDATSDYLQGLNMASNPNANYIVKNKKRRGSNV